SGCVTVKALWQFYVVRRDAPGVVFLPPEQTQDRRVAALSAKAERHAEGFSVSSGRGSGGTAPRPRASHSTTSPSAAGKLVRLKMREYGWSITRIDGWSGSVPSRIASRLRGVPTHWP